VAGDKNFLWQNIMSIKILKTTARYDIPAPAIRIGFVLSPPKNNTNGKPSGNNILNIRMSRSILHVLYVSCSF
jgi:hypothetical protein